MAYCRRSGPLHRTSPALSPTRTVRSNDLEKACRCLLLGAAGRAGAEPTVPLTGTRAWRIRPREAGQVAAPDVRRRAGTPRGEGRACEVWRCGRAEGRPSLAFARRSRACDRTESI